MAEEDLTAARFLLAEPATANRIACFLAQQERTQRVIDACRPLVDAVRRR